MTAETATKTLRWDPPGKGDWRGLHDHFPRAVTPEYQRLLTIGLTEGEAMYMEKYGLPARTLQPGFVNGRVFVSAVPLVGPATNRVPPAPLLWIAVRLVPTFRRRAAAAREAVKQRRWRAEAAEWYGVQRSEWQQRNERLEHVDVPSLDTAGLCGHLADVRANAEAGYREHFRLHGPDLIPTAMFIARASDWGIPPVEAAGLLAGFSPASRGDRQLPDWCLVTGYDVDDRAACELPSHSAARVAAVEHRVARSAAAATEPELRERVPAGSRDEWDVLLEDARATYGVRDDNGILTGAWPVGLLRRAMLEAGRRLVARTELGRADDAVELTVDELNLALRGEAGAPSGAEAASRRAERQRLSGVAAPASLGPPLDPPLRVLPPAMRELTRGLLTVRDVVATAAGERIALHGVGIGTQSVSGRACVASDPAEALARFEPGDIVVTAGTCPAWNTILAVAGGVVTEEGGPLSHAAVIARELGLPALIGTAAAMSSIRDGDEVVLDAAAGVVRVTSRH